MKGKNQAAMGNGVVVKSPTKKESVTKTSAPKGAVPAYGKGGMVKKKK
jgi:hypothetical protein